MEEIPENKWLSLPESLFALILSKLPTKRDPKKPFRDYKPTLEKDLKALTLVCKRFFFLTYKYSERFRYLLAVRLEALLNVLEANDPEDTSFPEENRPRLYVGLSKKLTIFDDLFASHQFLIDLIKATQTSDTLEKFLNTYREEMRLYYKDEHDDASIEPDSEALVAFSKEMAKKENLTSLETRLKLAREQKTLVLAKTSTFWAQLATAHARAQSPAPVSSTVPAPH